MEKLKGFKIFLSGFGIAAGIFLISGAGRPDDAEVKRYQMTVFGETEREGLFVIDSKAGIVKIAHYRNHEGLLTIDNLGKDFEEFAALP
ncbi:MAG: hypothetical protein HY954_01250 [Deltaproteobacteria bacterium]|nr:hypothetical protein [Deltaproteobacteria bacterium]